MLQAKYQHVEKEVALRGHFCVTAGGVGKRQDRRSLERDPRFPIWGRALQMFIGYFFSDPKYLETKVECFVEWGVEAAHSQAASRALSLLSSGRRLGASSGGTPAGAPARGPGREVL